MQGLPRRGWRASCVLLVGGLAGCAGGPPAAPVAIDDASGQRADIVMTAGTTPSRRGAPSLPQPGRNPIGQQTAAPTHADVLASARQLEQLGRYAEAQRAYLAVLQRHPQHVECMHRLAVVCTRLNDYDAARAYFDRGLQIAPGNVSMLTDAGYARFLAGEHRQAEKLLRRATELAPQDVRATNNLAVVVGVSGRFDDALALFWQVNPHAAAWTNLAHVYQLRNEPEQALTCYQRARELDSSILVPEELLAQTAPPESDSIDSELPPAPSEAPSRAAPRSSTVAFGPAHPLSVPSLSTPYRFDERLPDERNREALVQAVEPPPPALEPPPQEVKRPTPKVKPLPPAVVSANVPARDASEPEIEFSLPILASRKQQVTIIEAPPAPEPQPVAPPRLEPIRAKILPRLSVREEPALAEPLPIVPLPVEARPAESATVEAQSEEPFAVEPGPIAPSPEQLEDPFEQALPLEPPAAIIEEQPVVDEAPAFLAEESRDSAAPAAEIIHEPPFLPATSLPAPTTVDEAPVYAEELPPPAVLIPETTDLAAPAAEDYAEEDRTGGADRAVDAFVDSERAKLSTRTQRAGLKGFCLVALFEERKLVDTSGQYALEYRAQEYQFSSPAAIARFKADPRRYVPAAGGTDVVAARAGRVAAPGSLDFACWYRDRLYMFASQEHKDEFRANPRAFVDEK